MTKTYETVKLDMLTPYANNPRNNDNAVPAVKASIQQVGYITPIVVDENYEILAGHTRYKALKALGRKEAEILRIGGGVRGTEKEVPPVGQQDQRGRYVGL